MVVLWQQNILPYEAYEVLPQDVVNAHDALWLRVAAVVDDCAMRLQPHITTMLGQHPIKTAHNLALSTHCTKTFNINNVLCEL